MRAQRPRVWRTRPSPSELPADRRQGQGAELQEAVVPIGEREPRPPGRLRPQALDLALADFVGQRLAWVSDVAVDLGLGGAPGQPDRERQVHGPLTAPAE